MKRLGPVGVPGAAQQRRVVDALHLGGDQRPHVAAEPDRLAAGAAGAQPRHGLRGQQPGQVPAGHALLVVAPGVRRDAPAGTGGQPRFGAARPVPQPPALLGEAAAPADGEQDQVVEERQAQPAQQHRGARRDVAEVDVGGVGLGEVGESVDPGQARRACLPRIQPGGGVAQGQHHGVQVVQTGAVGQPYALRTARHARRVGAGHRAGAVTPDRDVRRRAAHDPAEAGAQVVAVERPGRIVVGAERARLVEHVAVERAQRARRRHAPGPLVQARARARSARPAGSSGRCRR